jgi:UDP-GlcNAc:undecaprenyl-phosphate GlcNAc-1-phosphate transferase
MTITLFVLPCVVAALLSFYLVRPAAAIARRVGAMDLPGPRKIHSMPVPRLGGLAVVIAASIVFAAMALLKLPRMYALPSALMAGIAAGLIPIFLVSFFDDIRSVKAVPKLVLHFVGAGIVIALEGPLRETIVVFGKDIRLGWLVVPFSLMWIVGVTNAFNIIDGLDGLSSGLAFISSASLAVVSLVVGHYEIACASLILAGALLGFLPFNIYPARIFLGDTGATAIGFMLACLTLYAGSVKSAGLAVTLPLLIVGVPLAETLVSIVRRIVRKFDGESSGVFDADRRHIHHRLLDLGVSQWRATLILYTVGAVLAAVGLASLFVEQQTAALTLTAVVVAAFIGISKLGYDEFAFVRRGALLRIYNAPVLRIGLFAAFVDIVLVIAALYATIVLKYDDWALRGQRILAVQLLALLPAVTVAVFASMRVYRCSWRYASVEDTLRIATASLTAGFVGYLVSAMASFEPVTWTFFVLYTLCLTGLTATSRLSYRVLYHSYRRANQRGEPVVIYGAGVDAALVLKEIEANFDARMKPVGFIDDDPTMRGRWVNGYPVFGSMSSLKQLVSDRGIRGVVVASGKVAVAKLNEATDLCTSAGLWIRQCGVSFQDVVSDRREPHRQKVEILPFADRRRVDRRAPLVRDVVVEKSNFIRYANDEATEVADVAPMAVEVEASSDTAADTVKLSTSISDRL